MANLENPAFNNAWRGFEAASLSADLNIAPKAVVSETKNMIGLLNGGVITPQVAKSYLETFTFPFLKKAAQGVDTVFDRGLIFIDPRQVDVNEAADFSSVVFSWMHYFARSRFLPDGFSQKGILRAPHTKDEFVDRLREIRITLPAIMSGVTRDTVPFYSQPALRTYAFLKVGSSIPLRFAQTDRERKQYEDEVLARFTEGLDLSF